jgi:hypothetical protein
MITWIAPRVFATSNDDRSIAVWTPNAEWNRLDLAACLEYDPAFGAANSGEAFLLADRVVLVTGHAEGFVTIWEGSESGSGLRLTGSIDVRSARPVNPWGIHNVRGVALVRLDERVAHVVTGSEDGDLCLLRLPDGKVVARETYNPAARRGINAIAAHQGRLLVANCAVGPEDPNLWLFTVDAGRETIARRDSAMLRLDPQAEQVFNFAVIWAAYQEGLCFFSSTQEGALWMGTVDDSEKLNVLGCQKVVAPLGAAIAFASNGNLAFVAYDLHEFQTNPQTTFRHPNPQRLF